MVHVLSSPSLRLAAACGLAAALAAGCSSSGSPIAAASPSHAAPVTMKLTSSAFTDRGPIPKLYTCDGERINPPLAWSGAPKDTAWFAVTVIDPGGPVLHWYLVDIPAGTTGIKQDAGFSTPGKEAASWRAICPEGGPDEYDFTVYAMPSSYKPPHTKSGYVEDEDGLAANAIGIGQLTGYYAD